jgi:hypothetical protein
LKIGAAVVVDATDRAQDNYVISALLADFHNIPWLVAKCLNSSSAQRAIFIVYLMARKIAVRPHLQTFVSDLYRRRLTMRLMARAIRDRD